ncbi:hypothetical protein H4R34_005451 [Dimargaris verticillata]|uniref:L-lactate dehydrogenase n=1 Tax=Dimargaris verticillata TaxID=2761393 RepID=A0A9W8B2C5_9FUNG|nr:hypothetical protein H4R34_005451 [Dimargaris verticillata]
MKPLPQSPLTKLAIIGAGSVGSTIAHSCIMRRLPVQILLNDIDQKRVEGEVLDLSDGTFLSNTTVTAAQPQEVGQCDIIVITAGAKQRPGESRAALIERNYQIMKSVLDGIKPIRSDAQLLVVANPVEILCHLAQKLSGLPHNQVFGSGTVLDSARLRVELADTLHVNEASIHCYVLGEHGDNQFVAWSAGHVGGTPLLGFDEMKNIDLAQKSQAVARKAYEIIDRKGSTYYGIGACVSLLVETVVCNTLRLLPISCYDPKFSTYVSTPAVLGARGVLRQVDLPLNQEESQAMDKAVASIKAITQKYH